MMIMTMRGVRFRNISTKAFFGGRFDSPVGKRRGKQACGAALAGLLKITGRDRPARMTVSH
jgi:hypothetical protein